jgi:hypothetical protein
MPVTIRNEQIVAQFEEATGEWFSLQAADGTCLLEGHGAPYEVYIEGKPLPWSPYVKGRRHFVESRDVSDDGRTATFVFTCEGIRITHRIELDAAEPLMRASVKVECLAGESPRRLTGIDHVMPSFVCGDRGDCLLQLPGQHIPPDTPYGDVAAKPLGCDYDEPLPRFPNHGWLQSAPDETPGLVAVENVAASIVASVWQYSEDANVFPTLDGDGTRITVTHRHKLNAWLRPGDVVESRGWCLLVTAGTLGAHLDAFRSHAYGGGLAQADDAASWVDDVRLLQLPPYPLAQWTPQLDAIAKMGFNVVHLNPVWDGHKYCVRDHHKIAKAVATAEELKAFVTACHERGVKVLFDFVAQGIDSGSPVVDEHPDWLVRDELDRPFGSHGWGSRPGAPKRDTWSMDWGNPEYRKFAVDWAVWNVTEFDIDGFRTEALNWKEPNWSPSNPRPAWQTTLGGVTLGEELRAALKAVKSEALLVSEVWGPIFQRSHDAAYDNGWLLQKVNAGWLKGTPYFTAHQWMRYIELNALARPAGARVASFTANHDTKRLAELADASPMRDAVSFVHVFSGGLPFVMWLEFPGREEFWSRLLAERAKVSGMRASTAGIATGDKHLFAVMWRGDGRRTLAVANLAAHPTATHVKVEGESLSGARVLVGAEGARTSEGDDMSTLGVELPVGGYVLVELP